MLCDTCKKNEATIHIKEIHAGQVVSVNLCADCARAKEEKGELGALGFNLAEVLFNIGKISEKIKNGSAAPVPDQAGSEPETVPVCPVCGWTPEKMRAENGKLGCPECYHTFETMLSGVLSHIQRGSAHLGKRPAAAGTDGGVAAKRFELEKLQRELEESVRREEYENAAVCRDRINQLKAEIAAAAAGAGKE